ncbi:MAG: type IV secretory system conjugative DNA transfer family protein [Methylacidiphilales bacterium]|nr:type IV secretory system conjugative DNA transfer family protein [Candidatus Methylacidiphilales bacterium]
MKTTDPYLISPELVINLHGIQFPLEYLYRHGIVVGQPGSGKTRCLLMPLIRAILETTGTSSEKKAAIILIDPKNELTPFLQSLTKELGREEDLIVFKPGTHGFNRCDIR